MRTVHVLLAVLCWTLGSPAALGALTAAESWGTLEMLGVRIESGTKLKFPFSRERTFEGAFLDSVVFAARGVAPGPTLCVTAAIRGDEINGVEIVRGAFASVDPKALNGTLLMLPIVNAAGFRTMDRYMPDRRDLNREFPGSETGSAASNCLCN